MENYFEPNEIVENIEPIGEEEIEPKVKKSKTKTIDAKTNYKSKGKTSISYMDNGQLLSMFVDGIYDGKIEITYKNTLTPKDIVKIKQL